MSTKPPLGKSHFEKYLSDYYPHDEVELINGLKLRPPRYYDKVYDTIDPEAMAKIRKERRIKAHQQREHQTPERLAVRKEAFIYKLNRKKGLSDENSPVNV